MRYTYLQSSESGLGIGYTSGQWVVYINVMQAEGRSTKIDNGQMKPMSQLETLEDLFRLHNIGTDPDLGDRPRAREIRSMSVGDVVVFDDNTVWFCANFGWQRIQNPAICQNLQHAAKRGVGAWTMIDAQSLLLAVAEEK